MPSVVHRDIHDLGESLYAFLLRYGDEFDHATPTLCCLHNLLVLHRDIYDLGESLYAFLLRYGDEFDYADDAVSVASGGIVRKNSLPYAVETGRWEGSGGRGGFLHTEDRLCVDDPLTGEGRTRCCCWGQWLIQLAD